MPADAKSAARAHARGESEGEPPVVDVTSETVGRRGWLGRTLRGATVTALPVATPEDLRRRRELEATKHFLLIILALIIAVAFAFPFLEVNRQATIALIAAYVVGMTAFGRTAWKLRTPENYGELDSAILGLGATIGALLGLYSFGYYSPASIVCPMGVLFFSLICTWRVTLLLYAILATVTGAMMTLIGLGVIEDHGVLVLSEYSPGVMIIVTMLVELVLFLSLYLGRATTNTISDAVVELHDKTREVAQREALLLEARRELDEALKVGGPGRFTEQLLGSYRLGLLLGRGAMSDVYEATHVDTGEPAAIKLLHRDVLNNPQHVRRFLREVRIASRLDLPNVVGVVEVGDDDAPVPYLAMERLLGVDLAEVLRREGHLEPDQVVDLIRQLGAGIDAAHEAGVVHRDLKPQNVFRHEPEGASEPVWVILDFGVSRLLDGSSSLTDGHAVGTPSYMSPEQARGREVDHRADVFSLGVLAYRSLTGRPAFTGREIPQILHEVVFGNPPAPTAVVPSLPEAVDAVLAVALAKRAADRWNSGGELASALERALAGDVDADVVQRAQRVLRGVPWGRRAADLR